MSMLTLDNTTMYYWNLSNQARSTRHRAGKEHIEDWQAGLQTKPRSGAQSSRGSTRSSGTTTSSSRLSHSQSVRSSLVSVRGPSANRVTNGDDDNAGDLGGVSDRDELEGKEYEDARDSPRKGKQRIDSKVCPMSISVLSYSHSIGPRRDQNQELQTSLQA